MMSALAATTSFHLTRSKGESSIAQPDDPSKHVYSRHLKKQPRDLYGQQHAIETAEMIQDSLILMENELWKLEAEDQFSLIEASIECPSIFESKEHRLMFLRCEQFNADMAAVRLSKYWKRRRELFGDAAYQPFTLQYCRELDEDNEFSMGFLRLLPHFDETGRSIIFIDPSVVEGQKYNNESMVRAAWYVLHAALENEVTQQKGMVFMVNLNTTLPRHFDRSLTQQLANSIRGVLPVRVSCIHIFKAPYLFEILFDAVGALLGERLTKRIKLYSGEDNAILENIEGFGLVPSMIPVDLGGEVILDQDEWLVNREKLEHDRR